MQTYSGLAVFIDDGGMRNEIHVELEEIRDGEWAGILDGPVDWDALMGDRELLLELADPDALGFRGSAASASTSSPVTAPRRMARPDSARKPSSWM